MSATKKFFQFVLPSVLSFALSGVYSIVDGYFVGNSIGDLGLSAVTIAYPIVAVIQAIGTGLVPFIRNHGGSFYAMVAMIAGFLTNIFLDWLFV